MRINKTQEEIKAYFPDVTDSLGTVIPAFSQEKEAREFASTIGWGSCDIIRIDKRFERVYCIGRNSISKTKDSLGNDLDEILFPLGKYDQGNMQVVSIKRII